MATTLLQATNSVLRRLRETEVVSTDESVYSKLIVDFINDIRQEVENSHQWVQLRNTIQVTTVSGTFRYTLTGAGTRYQILQVFNDTQDLELRLADYRSMNRKFLIGVPQRAAPTRYDVNGSTAGDPNVDMWPIPDREYVINFNIVLPQNGASSGNQEWVAGTDDTTIFDIPAQPILLGAYALALEERGEQGGISPASAQQKYINAWNDAVALDKSKLNDIEDVWETV